MSEDQCPETEPQTGEWLSVQGSCCSPAFSEGRARGCAWTRKDRLAHAHSVSPVCTDGHQITLTLSFQSSTARPFRSVPFPRFLGDEQLASVLSPGNANTPVPPLQPGSHLRPSPASLSASQPRDAAWVDPSGVQMPSTPSWSPISPCPGPLPAPHATLPLPPSLLPFPPPRGGWSQLAAPQLPTSQLPLLPMAQPPPSPSPCPFCCSSSRCLLCCCPRCPNSSGPPCLRLSCPPPSPGTGPQGRRLGCRLLLHSRGFLMSCGAPWRLLPIWEAVASTALVAHPSSLACLSSSKAQVPCRPAPVRPGPVTSPAPAILGTVAASAGQCGCPVLCPSAVPAPRPRAGGAFVFFLSCPCLAI